MGIKVMNIETSLFLPVFNHYCFAYGTVGKSFLKGDYVAFL